MNRRLLLSSIAAIVVLVLAAPARAQTCAPGCGECEGGPECDGLSVGDACSFMGETGTCVLVCPSEGDCCGCDTSLPPDVPATSWTGWIVLVAGVLAAMSVAAVLRHRRPGESH